MLSLPFLMVLTLPLGGAGRGSFFSEADHVVSRRQGAVEERNAVGVEVEGDGRAGVVL